MKIGVLVDCLKLGVKKGIITARDLGFDGVQVYAVTGEISPETLSKSGRKEFCDFVAANSLELAALVGEVGGFDEPASVDERVNRVKEVLDLARDLRAPAVTAHVGMVSPDKTDPRRKCLMEALTELGECGERVGVFFGVETGMESAVELKELLDELHKEFIRVNYDPANLVMLAGDDPIAGVRTLSRYIVHVHAKDGVRKGTWSLRDLFAEVQEKGRENVPMDDWFMETPLGEGQVDIPRFIKVLAEIGYSGFVTIEREAGENVIEDITRGRDRIRDALAHIED